MSVFTKAATYAPASMSKWAGKHHWGYSSAIGGAGLGFVGAGTGALMADDSGMGAMIGGSIGALSGAGLGYGYATGAHALLRSGYYKRPRT